MNRLQLVKRARQHLAEAGQGQYNDATLQDQISISSRSLAGELGLIQAMVTATSSTTGGASGYLALPTGVVNVIRAFVLNTGAELTICAASDVLAFDPKALAGTTAGAANYLIVDEGLLGPGIGRLYPASPDGSEVTVYAFVDGGDLATDLDTPWGGRFDAYHDVIAYHAAHHLITRQGKAASNDPTWFNRYHDRLEALRDRGTAGQLTDHARFSAPIRSPRRWHR